MKLQSLIYLNILFYMWNSCIPSQEVNASSLNEQSR